MSSNLILQWSLREREKEREDREERKRIEKREIDMKRGKGSPSMNFITSDNTSLHDILMTLKLKSESYNVFYRNKNLMLKNIATSFSTNNNTVSKESCFSLNQKWNGLLSEAVATKVGLNTSKGLNHSLVVDYLLLLEGFSPLLQKVPTFAKCNFSLDNSTQQED